MKHLLQGFSVFREQLSPVRLVTLGYLAYALVAGSFSACPFPKHNRFRGWIIYSNRCPRFRLQVLAL